MSVSECCNLSWIILSVNPWLIVVRSSLRAPRNLLLGHIFLICVSIMSFHSKLLKTSNFMSIQNIHHKLTSCVGRSSTRFLFFVASKCYNYNTSHKVQLIKIMLIIPLALKILIVCIIVIRRHIYKNKIKSTLINMQ